uniref:Uncharacterized protein n=1 Tax=Mammaliicoccus phage MSShimriz1 TaxID=3230127 RepID=A0AAU8GS54_9VIRU
MHNVLKYHGVGYLAYNLITMDWIVCKLIQDK